MIARARYTSAYIVMEFRPIATEIEHHIPGIGHHIFGLPYLRHFVSRTDSRYLDEDVESACVQLIPEVRLAADLASMKRRCEEATLGTA